MRARVFATLALSLVLAFPALADVAIEKKTHNEPGGMPGASAGTETSTAWIGDKRLAEVGKGQRVVVQGGEKLLIIDDTQKTYHKIDLPIDFAKLAPGMEQMFEQFAEQLQLKVEVVPTEETREINGFPTKKSRIDVSSAMGVTGEINVWLTNKVDFDVAFWRDQAKQMASLSPPGMGDIFKSITELEGFPILQEVSISMMGQTMKVTEEVLSVTEKDPPAGIYEVPDDYTEQAYDPMAAMQGQ